MLNLKLLLLYLQALHYDHSPWLLKPSDERAENKRSATAVTLRSGPKAESYTNVL